MCAGCGILQNGQDWTESFGQESATSQQKLAEKRKRIQLVNEFLKPCGLILREQGVHLILSNQTGKSVVITQLAHVWTAADQLNPHKQTDPLFLI